MKHPPHTGDTKMFFCLTPNTPSCCGDYPDRLDRLISELSSYMESTGRSYQNHAATIRRWAENDKTKGVPKQGIPDYTCKEGESL